MMMQLNPQIPLKTPKGNGQAIMVIDYSEEHDLKWVVILDDGGEIWAFKNSEVRGFENKTMGRAYNYSKNGEFFDCHFCNEEFSVIARAAIWYSLEGKICQACTNCNEKKPKT